MAAKLSLSELLAKEQAEKEARLQPAPQVKPKEEVAKASPAKDATPAKAAAPVVLRSTPAKAAEPAPASPDKPLFKVVPKGGGGGLEALLAKEQAAKTSVLEKGVSERAEFTPLVKLQPAKLKSAGEPAAVPAKEEPAAAAVAEVKPVEVKPAVVEVKPAAVVAAKPAAAVDAAAPAAKVGKITNEAEANKKIYIEDFSKVNKDVVEVAVPLGSNGEPSIGIFIGRCTDVTIKLTGKAKNITLSGCKNVNVVFEQCVTMCEIIRCEKTNVQAEVAAGTFQIDKCDRVKVYLPEKSLEDRILVFSSQSTSSNMIYATPDGEDQVEYPIPEQIISTFKRGVPAKSNVVLPSAE